MSLKETIEALQNGLIDTATGGSMPDSDYLQFRRVLMDEPALKDKVPPFLRTCRSTSQFWQFIKHQYSHYRERRDFIWSQFNPILESLEGTDTPAENVVSEVLKNFDLANVYSQWSKSLERRKQDPEGAITAARTLLETVCKHILDEDTVSYPDGADLPKLYRVAAEHLNIAPSQHVEPVFKQILGGCTAVVEGLGALRNKLSDAHGKGKLPVKPAPRHAELAVNLAGTMAAFLVSTWESKQEKP
jgi:hypothetical protein